MAENLETTYSHRRVTIVDLARELGVTPGTISRALTNNSRVKAETREKVMELAQRWGYRPNLAARSLASNQGR